MSKQAGEVARQAAAIIRRRGWCQGRFTDGMGRCCVRSAFTQAAMEYGSAVEREFTLWMNDIVGLPLVDPRCSVGAVSLKYDLAVWNDEPGRTKEEVLTYLDKFAEEHDCEPVLP